MTHDHYIVHVDGHIRASAPTLHRAIRVVDAFAYSRGIMRNNFPSHFPENVPLALAAGITVKRITYNPDANLEEEIMSLVL